MKSFPTLIAAGAAVLLIGAIYYFQGNEKKSSADVSIGADSTKASTIASGHDQVAPQNANANTPANAKEINKGLNEDILQRPDSNPNFTSFKDRVTEVEARRNGRHVDPQQLWDAAQQPNAWKPLSGAPDSLNLSDVDKNDGRKFIELSPLKLESLVAGDTLDIDLGDASKSLKVNIDGARSEDEGKNVTWTGDSIDPNSPYHLTITKGDSLVVGGISTPDGLYEIEIHDGKGWIVSNATLFRKGTDEHITVPDELIKNPPKDAVVLPKDPAKKY